MAERTEQSPDDLREIAASFVAISQSYLELANKMDSESIKSMEVRGMGALDTYIERIRGNIRSINTTIEKQPKSANFEKGANASHRKKKRQ